MFSQWIRRSVYWTFDMLRGSKVRKHYNDIKYIIENNGETADIREKYLSSLLNHATNTTPFYKKFKDYNELQDFPVTNRNFIKENYEQFQSQQYVDKKVFVMHTSGTTGTPFEIRQDMSKRYRILAEQIYYGEQVGYFIGMKYIFFRVWTEINKKGWLKEWATNLVPQDIVRLDEKKLFKIRRLLQKDKRIKCLLGYASSFENLANYLIKCGDTPDQYNVEIIISGAESLPEYVREKLIKVFGCTVVSRYSNQDNGMLAQECKEKHEFHINNASFFVELLKMNSDEPVSDGEMGRIVVTDLFNYAMPLIRYDTGDVGMIKGRAECGLDIPVLKEIYGRVLDFIYDPLGNKITPLTIIANMWYFSKIKQFQFIQKGKREYILKLNGARKHYKDEEFKSMFKKILGSDVELNIEHISEIPVLSSGKRKPVVCNYVPN